MLGVEPEMYGQARQWSHDIKTASRFTVGRQTPTADEDAYLRRAMKDYGNYLEHLVNFRREHPGASVPLIPTSAFKRADIRSVASEDVVMLSRSSGTRGPVSTARPGAGRHGRCRTS